MNLPIYALMHWHIIIRAQHPYLLVARSQMKARELHNYLLEIMRSFVMYDIGLIVCIFIK